MNIAILGPWILLAMGIVLLCASIKLGFAKDMMKQMVLMIVTGTLLSGSSVWGLGFMSQYADFLDSTNLISSMLSEPSAESYGEALDAVAKGDLKPGYSEAIVVLASQKPIDGMDEILRERINTAPDTEGKKALTDLRDSLKQKEQTANVVVDGFFAEGRPAMNRIKTLDPSTRFYVNKQLLMKSEAELGTLDIDPRVLKQFQAQRFRNQHR